jgi:putative ABC transport system permease protein
MAPIDVLKSGGPKSSAGRGERQLLRGVTMVQTALTLALLVGAGLLIRTIRAFDAVDTGVNVADVVIGTVEPAITGRYDEARLRQFYAQLLPRLRSIPGVTAAALGRIAPVTSHGFGVSARVLDKPGSFTETRGLSAPCFRSARPPSLRLSGAGVTAVTSENTRL